CNTLVEFRFFLKLRFKLRFQAGKALHKIKIIIFFGQTYVATGGEHIVQFSYPFFRDGCAEAGYVFVTTPPFGHPSRGGESVAPVMVCAGNLLDIFRREYLGSAVDQVTQVAGVYEKYFTLSSVSPKGRETVTLSSVSP